MRAITHPRQTIYDRTGQSVERIIVNRLASRRRRRFVISQTPSCFPCERASAAQRQYARASVSLVRRKLNYTNADFLFQFQQSSLNFYRFQNRIYVIVNATLVTPAKLSAHCFFADAFKDNCKYEVSFSKLNMHFVEVPQYIFTEILGRFSCDRYRILQKQ